MRETRMHAENEDWTENRVEAGLLGARVQNL